MCRFVVGKFREFDELVESCRVVVDILVVIRFVEVELILWFVVLDKGIFEEVELKRLVNLVVVVFVEIGLIREIGIVCCRFVMIELIGVGIFFGCKFVVVVVLWFNVWIICVFVIVVFGFSDLFLCGLRVELVWFDILCGDWFVVVVVFWLDVLVVGLYVVVVLRRCDGLVEIGFVVFNLLLVDEWVLGILVIVEFVEFLEDDVLLVFIMLNDEYVVLDLILCVVMFVGGIFVINILIKLE